MQDWTKVVTDPLGLVGFTLFLLFGALARFKRNAERSWIVPLCLGAAVLTLAGGLTLAFFKEARPAAKSLAVPSLPPVSPQQVNQQVEQKTTGAGSPAVQGVQGNVTITVDQSAGTWKKRPVSGDQPKKSVP